MVRLIRVAAMLAIFTAGSLFASGYSGGSGIESDPFKIATVSDWQQLLAQTGDWGAYFELVDDVNLADVAISPVGVHGNSFTGQFDGNGYCIKNPQIILSAQNFVGLFGKLQDAKVLNLNISDANMDGSYNVGALAGAAIGQCQIINCTVSGKVSGSSDAGGLCGLNEGLVSRCKSRVSMYDGYFMGGLVGTNNGIIEYSYATGNVIGGGTIGGLVGRSGYDALVENSFATGNVSGISSGCGGLAGLNYSMIRNCFARGNVYLSNSRRDYVAGLLAQNHPNGDSVVENCYSTGTVGGGRYYKGGLVGKNDGAVLNSFWDMQTSLYTTSAGGTGLNTAEMQDMSTFINAGWDFIGESVNDTNDIWIYTTDEYPRFSWNGDEFMIDVIAEINYDWLETTEIICDYDGSGTVNFVDYSIILGW